MRELGPRELQRHLRTAEAPPLLLDVREPWEYRICHLDDSKLVPMGQVPNSLDQLDPSQGIVVICHHGVRSAYVGQFLEHRGFSKVINLRGGLDAWARELDTHMAIY